MSAKATAVATKPMAFASRETAEDEDLARVVAMLGGQGKLKRKLARKRDAHDLLVAGLPSGSLDYLLGSLSVLRAQSAYERALDAVGISERTVQRHKSSPGKRLSRTQSGQVWRFAEILAKASAVFGSQAEAEAWLSRPAIGLDQCRPIDLLITPAGTEIVETFLQRLEFGVYA